MLDNSNEPAHTVTHPYIAKQSAQQATLGQQYGRTELPISIFYGTLDRLDRIL